MFKKLGYTKNGKTKKICKKNRQVDTQCGHTVSIQKVFLYRHFSVIVGFG